VKTTNLEILEKTQLPTNQARAILNVMELEITAREEVLVTKSEFREAMLASKADLLGAVHGLELKLEAQRADLIGEIKGTVRWNFAFWVAQLAAIAGILKLLK